MPRFYLSEKEVNDLVAYAADEWLDPDLQDAEAKQPAPPADTPEVIARGAALYDEMSCAGCHDLNGQAFAQTAPDLTFEGSKAVHDLDFGDLQAGAPEVRHTLPDFLFTKLKSPLAMVSRFHFGAGVDRATALWRNLRPAAMFAQSATLPEGTEQSRLEWILAKAQEQESWAVT